MTNTEAASVVAILHGAYPGTYFDGAVAEVFTNSLLVTDFEAAQTAAQKWVASMQRFPTVAELNGEIRRVRERSNEEREIPAPPSSVATREQARAAFSSGYAQARSKAGDDMDGINQKLDRHLRSWGLTPTTEEERRARKGASRQQTNPSGRRLGDRPWNTEPRPGQPSVHSSTSDEPW